MADWLEVHRGEAPLIVSFPHTGEDLPPELEPRLVSAWRARKDADWHIHQLYGFARELGATTVRTSMSRTVIDVNRDPSGASLYPGQATTELCPTTTFDGEPLYRDGETPGPEEIAARRQRWFDPYHAALQGEVERLRARYGVVVLYDAHSIRSQIPRLFDGELPHLNLGTNRGASCAPELRAAVARACEQSDYRHVVDGRFVGGWTTRRYGRPAEGVHALQMELACRGYLDEPAAAVREGAWPPPYDPLAAAPLAGLLRGVLTTCLEFTKAAA